MEPFQYVEGNVPLLVSMPHIGTHVPPGIREGFTTAGRALTDTDWHLDQLYDFLGEVGASVLQATHHRYVIDLNRAPDSRPLYAGVDHTALVPTRTFEGDAIYRSGKEPGDAEVENRLNEFWRPYHDRLGAEMESLVQRFGIAVLFDCHSIRPHIPGFIEKPLRDFNLGTADLTTCSPGLRERLAGILTADKNFTSVIDGRFKGGYIPRCHGRPTEARHAFQLELSMATYADTLPPFELRQDLAPAVRPTLRRMVEAAIDWANEKRRD